MPNDVNFADWIAICEVKARYCRLLDLKRWDEWGELFTTDMVLDTSAAGGPPAVHGRDAAVETVRNVLVSAKTVHQVHSPEIRIDGDEADVIWAMQDRVAFDNGFGLSGYGHYTERYRREDGQWRIARSTLTRLHIDSVTGGE